MKTLLQSLVIVMVFSTSVMAQAESNAVEVQKAQGEFPQVTLHGTARTKAYNPHRRYHLVPEASPTLGLKIMLSVGSTALAGALVVAGLVEPLDIGESQIETAIGIGTAGFIVSVVCGLMWLVRAIRNKRRAKPLTIGVVSKVRAPARPKPNPGEKRSNAGAVTGLILSSLLVTISSLALTLVSGEHITERGRRIVFVGLGGMLLGTVGLIVSGIRLRRNRRHNRQVESYKGAFLSPSGFGVRF